MFPEYIQSFPRLTENDLRALTLGVYHSVEHMSSDGSYRIYPSIKKTRARIHSRHVSAKKYILRISFKMNTQHHRLMVGIASAKLGQELLGVLRTLRQFFGTWYQRHEMDEVLSETN